LLKELKKDVLLKNQKGATVVEFAIILPLLLLLIFGIIEFGLFLFNRHVITNAVREAARAGIVVRIPRLSNEKIETIARNYCEQYLVTFGTGKLAFRQDSNGNPLPFLRLREDDSGELNPLPEDELGRFGDILIVEATYDYDWLFLSTIGIDQKKIQAIASPGH
jgi:Flp pilus assembly pilin Flp